MCHPRWISRRTFLKQHYYRAYHVLVDLGWVDLDLAFGEFPQLVGCYCSYLLPKQGGGTSQIQVNKTQSTRTWDALYMEGKNHDSFIIGRAYIHV